MSDTGGKKRKGAEGGGPNKKSRGWVSTQPKDPSQKAVPPNTWGVLLTCEGGREKRAVDEARVMIEEAYERLGKSSFLRAPPAQRAGGGTADAGGGAADADGGAADDSGGGGSGKSIAEMVAAEVAELKDVKRAVMRWHDTGVPNTIFVALPGGEGAPRPSEVAADIVAHVKATKQLPARFLIKILPIEATCFVGIDEIRKLAGSFLPARFPSCEGAATTFAVDMERRACGGLDHSEVINAFAKAVPPPHKVNLSSPDATVLVQLIRNVCAVAVAPRFRALCKYNVRVASEPEESNEGGGGGSGGGGAKGAKAGGGSGGKQAGAKHAVAGGEEPQPGAVVEKQQEGRVANAAAAVEAEPEVADKAAAAVHEEPELQQGAVAAAAGEAIG